MMFTTDFGVIFFSLGTLFMHFPGHIMRYYTYTLATTNQTHTARLLLFATLLPGRT